jgi:hypothetical protein
MTACLQIDCPCFFILAHLCPHACGTDPPNVSILVSIPWAGNAVGAQIMGREVYDSLSKFLEGYMAELLAVCDVAFVGVNIFLLTFQ